MENHVRYLGHENTTLLRIRSSITQSDGMYHFSGLYWDVDYRVKAK